MGPSTASTFVREGFAMPRPWRLRNGCFAAPSTRSTRARSRPKAPSPRSFPASVASPNSVPARSGCLPIHPIGVEARKGTRGSPYAVRDYRAVDPALGTLDDLRRLVDAAHARGLRVIIDFVANHAAPDHVLAGRHPEWLARDGRGRAARRVREWTDVADWRFDAEGAAEYLAESAAYWVREAGIDGYRCDVAGMVPRALWSEVHRRLAAIRPDHFMLAEWQDPGTAHDRVSRFLRLGALPCGAGHGSGRVQRRPRCGTRSDSGRTTSRLGPCRCDSSRTTTSRAR